MRFLLAPPSLLQLIATILLTPRLIIANPAPAPSSQAGFEFNELVERWSCTGQLCGWNDQLCCPNGGCYTNALQQAQCTGGGALSASAAAAPSSAAGGGYWQVYTTVYTVTDKEVVTSVYSTYMGGSVSAVASAAASGSARCNYALNQSPCGDICCAGNQYCKYPGQCAAAAAAETTTTGTVGPAGAPIRPTSSGVVVVTSTKSPTATVPFETPVATGANVTMTAVEDNSGGLSGGAIAGIVIGVLIGLLILGLICFYCCIKGLLDGCLALFGLGGRKKRRTEVTEYERHSHHDSRGGGRTWYGAAKPSRVERRRESHNGRNIMGGLAGLAGLWAILGLKRKREDRRNEKRSEVSYSSDYYTSSSSQSSDDRRTRYTSRSRR